MTSQTENLKFSVERIVQHLDKIAEIEKSVAGDARSHQKVEAAIQPLKRAIIDEGIAIAIVLGGSIIRIADALDKIAAAAGPVSLLDVAGANDASNLGVKFEDKPSRERM